MVAKDCSIDVATAPVCVASGAKVYECDVSMALGMHLTSELVDIEIKVTHDDVRFWLRRKGRECAAYQGECVIFVLRSVE
jgi:hypothetical protein